jgi:hypothetical protein
MKEQILHRSWNILFQFVLGADLWDKSPCLSHPVGRCGFAVPNQSSQAILKKEAASLFIQLIDIDEILGPGRCFFVTNEIFFTDELQMHPLQLDLYPS